VSNALGLADNQRRMERDGGMATHVQVCRHGARTA
jgi:hypothetical protein